MSRAKSAAARPIRRPPGFWDARIGSARVQARNWRLIAFGNMFLAAGLAGGMIASKQNHLLLEDLAKHIDISFRYALPHWA